MRFLSLLLVLLGLAGVSAAAKETVDLETSITRGIQFLLSYQNKDGSWGTAQNTKDLNIYAPVPGSHQAFRAAVTAMCIEALIETATEAKDPKVKEALDRGEVWLLKNLPHVRRANETAIYNVWTHAYSVQTLIRMLPRSGGDKEREKEIRALIEKQFDMLRRYESVDGGWGYYDFRAGAKRPSSDSISFVTATVMIAFDKARQQGIEVPADLVKRGIASINRQRKNDHSYLYGEYLKMDPMMGINRPGGSLSRSQACNLALRVWGDTKVTDQVMTNWLDRLITRNDWLSFGRKRPIPHESWFQVAGYFYYYGHYYAALCIENLSKHPEANRYRKRIADIIIPLQEKDGSWWDYPLYNYHRPYGTAFALMTLLRCRPDPKL